MAKIERGSVATRKGTPIVTKPKAEFDLTGRKPGEVSFLKGVFFGPPKTGKTSVGASMPNVLLVQFDPQGDTTETLAGRDDITVVEPRTQSDLDSLVKQLHAGAAANYNLILVDSITFLFVMLGGKDITDTWKANKDVRRAYGQAGAAVQQFVHDMLMLDANIIFTAHLRKVDTEDENGVALDQSLGENEVRVAVTPMVWDILGPGVGFIGRTWKTQISETIEVDGKKRRNTRDQYLVSFNDGDRSPAGSRLKMKAEYESTPTLLQDLADELIGGK